jgi:hypothetical protein
MENSSNGIVSSRMERERTAACTAHYSFSLSYRQCSSIHEQVRAGSRKGKEAGTCLQQGAPMIMLLRETWLDELVLAETSGVLPPATTDEGEFICRI